MKEEDLNEYLGKEERDKMLKQMERNKKAREKRRDESALREYEKWASSGYRTY